MDFLFRSSASKKTDQISVCEKFNDYLYVYERRPDAILRLFCFPYAGGNASIFSTKWSSSLPESVEYVAIQLPGRSARIDEKPFKQFDDMVQSVTDSMVEHITGNNPPFAFYGHSLGSLLAFEVCKELQKRYLPLPRHLYFSGRGGPCALEPYQRLDIHMKDHEFAEHCIEFFGPQPGLVNQKLFSVSLPPLRSDIESYYNYLDGGRKNDDKVTVPISVWGASGDILSQPHIIETWRNYTDSSFQRLVIRENDHHFHDKPLFRNTLATSLLQLVVRVREDDIF